MINAESCTEQEFYRSNNITLSACISRTIRLCLQYPCYIVAHYQEQFCYEKDKYFVYYTFVYPQEYYELLNIKCYNVNEITK